MDKKNCGALIHALFFAESEKRWEARLDARFEGSGILRAVFNEFVRYIEQVVTGVRPSLANPTPFLQFHEGFESIQYLLWGWLDDGEPIIETLIEMLNDPDRNTCALAIVSLGVGNIMWKEEARIEPYLRTMQCDTDPLLHVAADLALDYILYGRYVEAKTPPDTAIQQRIEQYAAQVMSGIAKGAIFSGSTT